MSDFQTASIISAPLDPFKRVRYSQGLVLGVDEFDQEQLYLMERDRLHQRALHGYGTVYGLKVSVDNAAADKQAMVTPGLAIDQNGQHICVPQLQCATLNDWLRRNADDVRAASSFPSAHVTAYVVLCYRQCETDKVPVPGEPCRTQSDSLVASRIADDFELKLSLQPPQQLEEEVVRRFGDLLGRIEIRSDASTYLDRAQIEALVGDLQNEPAPDSFPGSFPSDQRYYLRPEEACDLLHAAFQFWVTEVRPVFFQKVCASPAGDECITLAQLDFNTLDGEGGLRVDGDVTVFQDDRPVLLHTRLLQEWLLCGRLGHTHDLSHTFVSLFAISPDTLLAWVHHPQLLDIPLAAVSVTVDEIPVGVSSIASLLGGTNVFELSLEAVPNSIPHSALAAGRRVAVTFDAAAIHLVDDPAQTLLAALDGLDYSYLDRQDGNLIAYLFPGVSILDDLHDVDAPDPQEGEVLTWGEGEGRWTPQPLPPVITDHGELDGLGDDDHTQYLLVSGARALGGDWSAGSHRIMNVADAVADGDALPHGNPAGGDLSGAYPNPTVARLQGNRVASVPAADINSGDVLKWDGAQWAPAPDAVGGGSELERDLTRIVALSWPHAGNSTLAFEMNWLDGRVETVFGVVIGFGKNAVFDGGGVVRETLHDNSVQLFTEVHITDLFPNWGNFMDADPTWQGFGFPDVFNRDDMHPSLLFSLRLQPGLILPVHLAVDGAGMIVGVIETDPAEMVVDGVALIVDPKLVTTLSGRQLRVVVKGDFILDESFERAIDAEHTRFRLPTGDRPNGSETGIQGGVFESWLVVGEQGEGLADINAGTADELRRHLPGVGPVLARAIIETRMRLGRFTRIEDLDEVPGIGPTRLNDLRPFIRRLPHT